MERDKIKSIIESLLFVVDKPLYVSKVKEVFDNQFEESFITEIFKEIKEELESDGKRGFKLDYVAEGWQIRTKEENQLWIKKLDHIKPLKLSNSALEVLAIIAYRQPIAKTEVDKIRGVDSYHIFRTLMEKNLIKISGRSDLPGKPLVYATTTQFLEFFGLSSLADLPSEKEIKEFTDDNPQGTRKAIDTSIRELIDENKIEITTYDEESEDVLEELKEIGRELKVNIDLVQEKVDILFEEACRKYEKQRNELYKTE